MRLHANNTQERGCLALAVGREGILALAAGREGVSALAAGREGVLALAAGREGVSALAAGREGVPTLAAGNEGVPALAAGREGILPSAEGRMPSFPSLARRFRIVRRLAFTALALMAASGSLAAELVLVAGASGRSGSAAIKLLDAQGYAIRALTTSRARAVERHGADWPWREVDVRDRSAVFAAMEGVDYVICAIGTGVLEGPAGPEFVDYGGVVNLVDAAVDAGIGHFVLMSSAAAGPYRERSRMLRLGMVRYWKTAGENHLKRSGLSYTIQGASGLINRPSQGAPLRVMPRAEYVTGRFTIGDAAMLLVDALTNPDARNKNYAVIGDDSVAPGAWRDMLKTLQVDSETEEAPGDLPPPGG